MMKVPKGFVNENPEKLFDELLEKNYRRETKLESIEDLVLKDIPDEIKEESYGHLMKPRYATKFDDIDTELDKICIGWGEIKEIDFIKNLHVTDFDVGLYKLTLIIIESKSEKKLREHYEEILNYEQERKHQQVKHLIKGKYVVLFVGGSRLDIESLISKKAYDYYKNKFDMKRINVRKVVELI